MSINQVIILGKLTKKQFKDGIFRGEIETGFTTKAGEFKYYNFVSCRKEMSPDMNEVDIGSDIYLEGKITSRKDGDKYFTEIMVNYFEVPNRNREIQNELFD